MGGTEPGKGEGSNPPLLGTESPGGSRRKRGLTLGRVIRLKKRLTDEAIISGLIEAGSIKAAADRLGYNVKTLYERMKKPGFKELYAQAKAELLKTATAKLQGNLAGAIDTLAAIMRDEETAKQTRANCAVAILQYAAKFTETTDIIERLEALEDARGIDGEAM